ncbi:unnamed protein product [Oncorhynchus mykiss]|uniref:PH domain-containing protein n=1 Tax=Oncorhynchus mykiss TaxID=8022 RepID=A0A060XB13_ONCMY|nr:unnamed protein product [Oncorhynchus mykiss]
MGLIFFSVFLPFQCVGLCAIDVEYLLKKICLAMSVELSCVDMEDFISQEPVQLSGITVWAFLDFVNTGRLTRGVENDSVTMAIDKVYQEIVGNIIKEGYLWKKGHLRRNWNERWFSLRPSTLHYYVSEDRKECKGCIELDHNCCVEVHNAGLCRMEGTAELRHLFREQGFMVACIE